MRSQTDHEAKAPLTPVGRESRAQAGNLSQAAWSFSTRGLPVAGELLRVLVSLGRSGLVVLAEALDH